MCTGKHKVCSSKCRQTCKVDRTVLPMSQEEIDQELEKRWSKEFIADLRSQYSSQEPSSEEEVPKELEELSIVSSELQPEWCVCQCKTNSPQVLENGRPLKETVNHSKLLSAGDATKLLKAKE